MQFRIHCEPHIIPIWPIFRYWDWYTFALRLRWCKMSESNCSSCSQNKGATITLHPAYKWHYRSSHACISFLSTLVPTQVGFVIPPDFYQAVDRLFSSFPFNISTLTQQANCSAPIRFASGRGWTYDGSDPSLYNAPSSRAWLLAVRASSLAYSYTIVVANGFSIFTSPSSVEGSYILRTL